MSYIVKPDLNASRSETELRPSVDPTGQRTPHWLLESLYGRELLKVALHKLHPQLESEADDHLEMVIDELQLREWKAPKTTLARAGYVFSIAKMYPLVSRGSRAVRHLVG